MNNAYFEKAKSLMTGRGDIKETLTMEDSIKLYVEAGEKALPEILPLFVDAKIPITAIEMTRPSLDEVFLRTTGHALENASEKELAK